MTHRFAIPLVALALSACQHADAEVDRAQVDRAQVDRAADPSPPIASQTSARSPDAPAFTPIPKQQVDTSAYAWHDDASIAALAVHDSLSQRIVTPTGFQRVALEPGSFGAWLRDMPLSKPGTAVLAYDGSVVHAADHRNIAAVTTLDVGNRDLQQCADAIMRLHGEWRWYNQRVDRLSYPSGGGPLPWSRYRRGEAPRADGNKLVWRPQRARASTHSNFRDYLSMVAAWANTVSLARDAVRPAPDDVRPGDFFVLPGSPGHAVLILDIAQAADGRRVALLGQSFMPAQNFQILRPSRDRTWFALEETGVTTPFWKPFPWSSLRRLDAPRRDDP